MSIRDQLERNLRQRVAANLESSRTILVELIRAPLNDISGQLKAGILVDTWREEGSRYSSSVRSLAPYSMWVDQGTGVYGPLGGRIYPRSAKALHFYWYKRGAWYTFASVRGSPAQNFFEKPMPDYFARALEAAFP